MQLITLSGEPKSTQHIYKTACRGGFAQLYMSREGKDLKEQYQWEAKAQWRGPSLTGPVSLSVRFYFGSKRKRDLDNQNKLILDALTGIAYEDDSQIAELHLYRGYDKQRPRIELTVGALLTH